MSNTHAELEALIPTTTAHTLGIKPGQYFVGTWGYDQTNKDFYRVDSVSKSGKTVHVVECETVKMDDTGQDEIVAPGSPKPGARTIRKILRFSVSSTWVGAEVHRALTAGFSPDHGWASWAGADVIPLSKQTNTQFGH